MGMEQDPEGPAAKAWLPEEAAVHCVTSNDELLEECARVAAVAGVRLEPLRSFGGPERLSGVGLLLLGADVDDVPPRWPSETVLVGRAPGRARLWQRAAELGVEHVAELPEAAGWLVEFLSRRQPQSGEGLVLGVLGGCGGAGASTTAVLLAAAASARGYGTALIDGDRWGGGIELLLADERPAGLSWPDLANVSGSINPSQLDASLPRVAGLAVLSWPAGVSPPANVSSSAVAGVLEASRRAFDLIIIDIGRGREAIEDFAWASDRLLMVVPGRLGAALASAKILQELPPVATGVLARGRMAEGVDAERLAATVGAPLAGRIPELRRAAGASESGRLLDLSRLRAVRRLAYEVLAGLVETTPAEPRTQRPPENDIRRTRRALVGAR